VIEKLIHIYVSCNTASHITVEMATILSLTALEILANVIIVENESMYDAKKYDRYSASRRISILLRHWKIPQDIPNDLPKLRCRAKRGGTNSGPEIVCQLRNSVVHPHEKNRKRLFSFSTEQRIECWILTMHYLELCLLRLLGYNQVYVPRIKRNIYAGYTEQVPWN